MRRLSSAPTALISALICALSVFSYATHASAEVNLTTPNGVVIALDDTGLGGVTVVPPPNSNDPIAVTGWPLLCVQESCQGDPCRPCVAADLFNAGGSASQLEIGGQQRALETQSLSGVEVTRRLYMPPSSNVEEADGFFRVIDSFYNPTTQPLSISAVVGSAGQASSLIGAPNSRIWRTSSYDADLSLEDRWLLIDDQEANAGSLNVTVTFQGSGGVTPDELDYQVNDRQLSWRYRTITIPARQSVSLITLVQLESNRADAITEAQNILRFSPADVTFGLDSVGLRSIYNVDINPDNASPLADLNGPYSGNEGQVVQLSAASSFDLEGAQLIYRWDIDGDGIFGEPGLESSGANVLILYPQDGDYPVELEVEDPGGKRDRDRVIVNIRNVRPTIERIITDSPIDEGGVLSLNVESEDVGVEDVLSVEVDWEGDGQFEPINPPATHRYLNDGSYTGFVRVSDQDGGERVSSFAVEVNNLPPVIQQVLANNPTSEGVETSFQVQAVDPGGDALTFRFDLDGDGFYDVTNTTGEASYTYPEDGNYQARIEVVDNASARSSIIYPISVQNVAPVITGVTVSDDPTEGEEVTITVDASDVGTFDLLTYEFDLDGQAGFEVRQSSPILRSLLPDSGRLTVGIRVSDDEGAVVARQVTVDVANQPPTGSIRFEGENVREGVIATGDQGRPFTVIAMGEDPSPVDAAGLIYNWDLNGDGVYELLAVDPAQTARFDQEGSYVIRCLIRDKDLGEVELEREVLIAGRPPELIGVTIESEPPYLEGAPVRFTVNADDPDPITYSFDFESDGEFDLVTDEASVRWAFPNEGEYEVTVRVADESGYVESRLTLTVDNAPPTVDLNTGVNVGEGDDLNIEITARDPGARDLVTVTVSFQDQTEVVTLAPNQSSRFTLPTQDDGFIDITASAVDDAGASSVQYTARAFIENRPPFIPPFSPTPAREGTPYSQVIPADDPAGLNDALFFSLIEPPANVEIEQFSGLLLWSPSYDDYLNSPITFELLIEDEDGGRLERAVTIEVLPRDDDEDGIPDTYEEQTCERFSPCLDSGDAADADLDPDGDGRTSLEEWEGGSDPFTFEGPQAPTQLSPGEGEVVNMLPLSLVVSHVESDRPLPPSPDGSLAPREVMIEYEIYADAMGESLVESSGPIMMRSIDERESNRWEASAEDLIEDQLYWWRVRALDGPAMSAWSGLRAFRVNTENRAPEAPTLALPLNESVVDDLTPELTFNPSVDPDGESVYFVVRVYRESPDGLVVDFGGQVDPDGEGPQVFVPAARLQENARYQWDVVAIDEVGLESEPSERWSFIVDLENEAPSEPILISPENGSTVNTSRPLFQAGGSVDQEGAPLSYHFEVRAVGEMDALASTSPMGVLTEGGVASWTPDVDLIEDQEHVVSVFVSDGVSQTGMITGRFYVSAEDNAPPKPTLLEPSDNALLAPKDAVLIWSEERDPERGNVRYQVEYCDPEGACRESDLLSNNAFSLEGLIPTQVIYSWRARSLDDAGNSLGYSGVRYLTLTDADSESANDTSGGCAQARGRATLSLYLFALILVLITTSRARKGSPRA